jgi:hypothetical protein
MNNDGHVITAEIRAKAQKILDNFHRPYTAEDRWEIEDRIAKEKPAQATG